MNLSQDQMTLLETIQDLADDGDYTDNQAISEKLGWELQLVGRHLDALEDQHCVNVDRCFGDNLDVRLTGHGQNALLNSNRSSNKPIASEINFSERAELVTLLLAISSIADRTSRATIIDEFPPEIKANIVYSQKDKTHVLSMVNTCLQYSNGMQDLESILSFFEDDSIPMERFKQALNRLGTRI